MQRSCKGGQVFGMYTRCHLFQFLCNVPNLEERKVTDLMKGGGVWGRDGTVTCLMQFLLERNSHLKLGMPKITPILPPSAPSPLHFPVYFCRCHHHSPQLASWRPQAFLTLTLPPAPTFSSAAHCPILALCLWLYSVANPGIKGERTGRLRSHRAGLCHHLTVAHPSPWIVFLDTCF